MYSSVRSGKLIRSEVQVRKRLEALDAFYRTLQKSDVEFLRQTYKEWLKIFPEAKKYIRP